MVLFGRQRILASTTLSLLTGVQVVSSVVFFQNANELPQDTKYDFIVAGGGIGGGVVASRLAENTDWKILIIEAGPSNEDVFETKVPGLTGSVVDNPLVEWNYTTVPQKGVTPDDRILGYSRAKVLGGCSSHNGLAYTRGSRDDYDSWADIVQDEGLSWDRILPLMKNGENFVGNSANLSQAGHFSPSNHGFHGPLFVSSPYTIHPLNDMLLQVPKELPEEFPFVLDLNGGRPIGVSWAHRTEDNHGVRSSSATAYVEAGRGNLHVLLNTYVTRVLPTNTSSFSSITPATNTDEKPDFRGIEFAEDEQSSRKFLFAKKEVIIAGGVVGTPQILLNSGIGSHSELEAIGVETIVDLPSVGRNFTDQVSINVLFNTSLPTTDFDLEAALAQWNATGAGPLVMSAPLKNQMVWVRLPSNAPAFKEGEDPSPGRNAPHIEINTDQISAATTSSVIGQLPAGVNGTNTIQISLINLHPVSRGSITLPSPFSPFSKPLIDPGLLTSPIDIAILREGIRSAQRLFSSPVFHSSVFGIVYPPEDIMDNDEKLDEFIRSEAGPYLHGGCSAMMSPRRAGWGVVDPDFGVKGVKGLKVVDASVLPNVPSGHTQASVYAIAERASRLIKEAWM